MVRRARVADARPIAELIHHYAQQGLLLPKPLGRIYESLRTFMIWEENAQVLGCGRLDIVWDDLAEVSSVAVHESLRGRGAGSALVEALVEEAHELQIPRLFALTYQVSFFEKLGFQVISKQALPQKIWKDCLACAKYDRCDEVAVLRVLDQVPALDARTAPTAADFGLSGFARMPTPAPGQAADAPPPRPFGRTDGTCPAGAPVSPDLAPAPNPGRLPLLP
ncbi:MAG: N-acetyltransferase [Acidobacteriota bacterium]